MDVVPGGLAASREIDRGDLILDVADQAIAAPEDVLVNTAKTSGSVRYRCGSIRGHCEVYSLSHLAYFMLSLGERISLRVVACEKHHPNLEVWSLPISFALPKSSTLSLLR
jgi:hypothetical protein